MLIDSATRMAPRLRLEARQQELKTWKQMEQGQRGVVSQQEKRMRRDLILLSKSEDWRCINQDELENTYTC